MYEDFVRLWLFPSEKANTVLGGGTVPRNPATDRSVNAAPVRTHCRPGALMDRSLRTARSRSFRSRATATTSTRPPDVWRLSKGGGGLQPGVQLTAASHDGVDIDKDDRHHGNRPLEGEVMDQPLGLSGVGSAGQQISLDPEPRNARHHLLLGRQPGQVQRIQHQIPHSGVGSQIGEDQKDPIAPIPARKPPLTPPSCPRPAGNSSPWPWQTTPATKRHGWGND